MLTFPDHFGSDLVPIWSQPGLIWFHLLAAWSCLGWTWSRLVSTGLSLVPVYSHPYYYGEDMSYHLFVCFGLGIRPNFWFLLFGSLLCYFALGSWQNSNIYLILGLLSILLKSYQHVSEKLWSCQCKMSVWFGDWLYWLEGKPVWANVCCTYWQSREPV